MSKITVSLYFTVTDLAQAAQAFAALHALNLNVQSVSAEEGGDFYQTASSGLVAADPVPTTSEQAPVAAENGKTPRGTRDINDTLAVTTDAMAGGTRYFNVYKNKPSGREYFDEYDADDAASDTRQALLAITPYDDGQVSISLKDVRGSVPPSGSTVKSIRLFNIYANRPSSRGRESWGEANEKASASRKAVLIITRFEDDTVGMQLVAAPKTA